MNEEEEGLCSWPPLDTVQRTYLGTSLIILGIVGAAANSWLTSTFLMSPLLTIKTHLLLLNLSLMSLGRGLLAGFPFAGTSTLAGRWLFGTECCQFFAFLRHFFSMSQYSSVTMLAVERIVVVRHIYTDYTTLQIYLTGILLCWIAAAAWAMPPLLGWGRYSCDPTAMLCSLDWNVSSNHPSFGYNVSLLLLGGVLPLIVTCVCLWRAMNSHRKSFSHSPDAEMNHSTQQALTKTVGVLVPGLYLVWLPQALLILWTLTGLPVPVSLIVMSSMCSEASAIVPTLACLTCEQNMRKALLGIMGNSREKKSRKKSVQLINIK